MKALVIYPKGNWHAKEDSYYPIEVERKGTIKATLETIWRMMNHVDNSEVEAQLNSFGCRSMCSGDKVFIDNELWLCLPAGWKLLHKGTGMFT